ncbi:MAG TPA: sensor domain-containing protein [Mycobacterium sp.]|nr:sensor domain-containing protein [Mycobacterium sp.]
MDGTPFGRYRLVKLLGAGGMGEVWRAQDTETDRVVAIKLLPQYLSADEEFQQRFRREAHAAASLNNPHVIPIHHYGEIDGQLYVDMRLIEGRDLQTVLAEGPLDPERAVRIVEQVARALHAAHKVGLIHRDIKPSNVLIDADDFAYLIDFGIALTADETRMTKSGNMLGTFAYIAPERLDPKADEDARVDIYSLACVLYEALTGDPPFPGSTTAHLITAHLNTPPPRPSISRPDVPTQVDNVIATGMAKDPNRRYATTIELANAAREAITDPIARPTPAYAQPPAEQTSDPRPPAAVTRQRQKPPTPAEQPYPVTDPGSEQRTPSPHPRRRAGLIAIIVTAVAVVAASVVGVTSYVILRHRKPSQPSTAQSTATTSDTAQSAVAQPNSLNGLLLSVDQINTAMGVTGMSSVGTMTALTDNSFAVSDPACLPLSGAAEAKVYANSGYSAVRAQVVAKAQQNALNQAAVLFPSAQAASAFFAASTQGWQGCANRQFTLSANGNSQVNNVGPVSDANGTLSATVTPANSLGVCERALTVANDVVIDVTACLGPTGAAVDIAHQIAAHVRGH